ncbi:MAG: hypothetical protein EBZ24_09930 [Synechococcaceae bacterium WB9_4xB_025]|nr:hypothetical protein [Synechococcaceae bacterium WB9_4xB_025]
MLRSEPPAMARLEQVTALVVAAGLAIVSYWLFFSWAGGGDHGRPKPKPSGLRELPESRSLRAHPGP